jgi:hypothetical protein
MSKTYLCIQRSLAASEGAMKEKPSPKEMEEMYAKFTAWSEKFGPKIEDMGGRLMDGCVVRKDAVTNGPFAESKEIVGGYMIVKADSLKEAIEVVQESPGVMPNGSSVEVREISTT